MINKVEEVMKKIVFIIAGGFEEASTLQEIEKIDSLAFDKDFYYYVKALEQNPLFVTAIENVRKKFNIPKNGYPRQEIETLRLYPKDTHEVSYISKELLDRQFEMQELVEQIDKESFRIYKALKLNKEMKQALTDIILSNCIYSTGPAIRIETDDDFGSYPERVEAVIIRVQKKVTKNQLLRFIEDNWSSIYSELKHLSPFSHAYISDRDRLILRLRDIKKLSYRKIADEIIKSLNIDDPEAKINEDSVKTAYKRAKNKIQSLAKG